MQCIHNLCDLESPSYAVPCSGVKEHAYVVSLKTGQFWKRSWIHTDAEEDVDKIDMVNAQLPDCPKLTKYFTGKLEKKLSEYYLGSKVVGFEDRVILEPPDAIFLQRVSARTKTFDMVFFYGTTPITFSVVDKEDLEIIREWFSKKIYSCGADPLPLKHMETWMKANKGASMYDNIYSQLFNHEESSCSEYEPESDPESEDESCADSNEDEDEEEDEDEDEEEEEDEDEDDDSDGEYIPQLKRKREN
jgi:hypothetical protein